jgi:peptide/nickel transport system substrate-binding protein
VVANHVSFVVINPQRGPLENDKLREAIAYAIDKEAINIAAFDGKALVADFLEQAGTNVGAPSTGLTYSYDPEKARKLVIEAGYEKGVDIGMIMTVSGSYFEKIAQVLQANLADVGISAGIDGSDNNTTLSRQRKQDFDLVTSGYNSSGDYENLRRFVHSSAVGSYYVKFEGDKFDYKRFDELFDRGGSELDSEKRAAIYKELNDLIMKTCTMLPVLHKIQPYVWAKDLSIPANYPNYPQIFEWSWKD